MKATKDARGRHVIVLARGEEAIAVLTDYCAREGIAAAVFQGIGAIERVKVGYYSLPERRYHFRDEPGAFEVASMQGNVALVEGKPFIHAHAVLTRCDETCEALGAHLKEAYVAVTLEVFLTELEMPLGRSLDEGIGLKLLGA